MENASKALIMAAEILMGVMIISIAVYLFNLFADYSETNYKEIEDTKIAEFNSQFLKYYGSRTTEDGTLEPIKSTIHDITSLANLAKKNNEQYDLQNEVGYNENSLYIQIDMNNKKPTTKRYINIEKMENKDILTLIKNNDILYSNDESGNKIATTKYYKCVKCDINPETKRVNYLLFEEI